MVGEANPIGKVNKIADARAGQTAPPEVKVEVARLILSYLQVVVWPSVAVLAIVRYRDVIRSLVPGAKVKLTIFGVAIETSIPVIEQSVTESLQGRKLTETQWSWLKKLRNDGRTEFARAQLDMLRPLRNAGLIRGYPEEFLEQATAVEITTLGKLLVDASEHGENRR